MWFALDVHRAGIIIAWVALLDQLNAPLSAEQSGMRVDATRDTQHSQAGASYAALDFIVLPQRYIHAPSDHFRIPGAHLLMNASVMPVFLLRDCAVMVVFPVWLAHSVSVVWPLHAATIQWRPLDPLRL